MDKLIEEMEGCLQSGVPLGGHISVNINGHTYWQADQIINMLRKQQQYDKEHFDFNL